MPELNVPSKDTRWAEFSGTIESISDDEIVLASKTRFRIKLSNVAIAEYRNILQVGKRVALLLLDDGTVRIRELCEDPEKASHRLVEGGCPIAKEKAHP